MDSQSPLKGAENNVCDVGDVTNRKFPKLLVGTSLQLPAYHYEVLATGSFKEVKLPSEFLIAANKLIGLLDQEDELWFEERGLFERKRLLKEKIHQAVLKVKETKNG